MVLKKTLLTISIISLASQPALGMGTRGIRLTRLAEKVGQDSKVVAKYLEENGIKSKKGYFPPQTLNVLQAKFTAIVPFKTGMDQTLPETSGLTYYGIKPAEAYNLKDVIKNLKDQVTEFALKVKTALEETNNLFDHAQKHNISKPDLLKIVWANIKDISGMVKDHMGEIYKESAKNLQSTEFGHKTATQIKTIRAQAAAAIKEIEAVGNKAIETLKIKHLQASSSLSNLALLGDCNVMQRDLANLAAKYTQNLHINSSEMYGIVGAAALGLGAFFVEEYNEREEAERVEIVQYQEQIAKELAKAKKLKAMQLAEKEQKAKEVKLIKEGLLAVKELKNAELIKEGLLAVQELKNAQEEARKAQELKAQEEAKAQELKNSQIATVNTGSSWKKYIPTFVTKTGTWIIRCFWR